MIVTFNTEMAIISTESKKKIEFDHENKKEILLLFNRLTKFHQLF